MTLPLGRVLRDDAWDKVLASGGLDLRPPFVTGWSSPQLVSRTEVRRPLVGHLTVQGAHVHPADYVAVVAAAATSARGCGGYPAPRVVTTGRGPPPRRAAYGVVQTVSRRSST